jgi:asparagine synthase (glutamine-hydrolysing)
MCGIAGRVNLGSEAPVDAAVVTRMCDLLAHRGPDGDGVYVDGPVGLGHRRLAIIDLSPAGRQPMAACDGRYWITFNGEIYNFLELRAEFESRGWRFTSRTDTEVLLAAYATLGPQCVRRLRGMFAFAIWDAQDRSLFAARDRLGKKPFFYRTDADGLAFASEPKAFFAEPGFDPQPALDAIHKYLAFQYVPSPWSAFRGVRKLPPAHYLLYRDGVVNIQRYWTLRYDEKTPLGEDEACERLVQLLREAVRLRLISDVPLGAFLSGGIDSGAVVALMSEFGSAPVKTFSIGFDEEGFDELAYARQVAQRYHTDHHEFVVRPEAAAIIPDLVWHYGEPFADSSAIPTFYLSKLTRQHVTVALNGDAGDENFAGYDRYVPRRRDEMWRRVPAPVRRFAAASASLLPGPSRSDAIIARGQEWLARRTGDAAEQYIESMMQFGPRTINGLCTPEFLAAAGGDARELLRDAFRRSTGRDFLDRALDVDVGTYLPDALLVKVDIATMAYSLEGRSPLLDHHLVEFAAQLPPEMKLQDGVKKRIFKKAMRPFLPAAIIDRPKKGFSVPLVHWFRRELRDFTRDVLLSPTAQRRGLFKRDRVERLLREHIDGRMDWHSQIWNLLMLELWFRRCVDERGGLQRVPGAA